MNARRRLSPEAGRKIMRDAYRRVESYHRRRRRRHRLYIMFRGALIWIVFAFAVIAILEA